jgi:SAM-dependent methyltransferase
MNFHFTAGLPETECGYGSTLACTENLRAELPALLEERSIDSLLDAPCGDGNWMAHVAMPWVDYIGVDINRDHLAKAIQARRFAARTANFIELDILTEKLPSADIMVCRDFLQHLPNAMIRVLLGNFLASAIKWLLVTTHHNAVNEDITEPGMFRPLNLMRPPFAFPSPEAEIQDPPGGARSLALWHRDAVMQCAA